MDSTSKVGPREVSQRELAATLNLTVQQIRNLEDRGIPYRAAGRRKFYPVPGAVEWYVGFKSAEALARAGGGEAGSLADSRARRERARARLAEIEVAEAEGRLLTLDVVEELYGTRILDTLRAGLMNLPGRWGAQIVGLESPREGEAILKRAAVELLEEWSGPLADAVEAGDDGDELTEDFPGRAALAAAGLDTMTDVLSVEDFRSIAGIGPATEKKILRALTA